MVKYLAWMMILLILCVFFWYLSVEFKNFSEEKKKMQAELDEKEALLGYYQMQIQQFKTMNKQLCEEVNLLYDALDKLKG